MSKLIPISVAERIAKEYGMDQVIIIATDRTEVIRYQTTYGKNKNLCHDAKYAGEVIACLLDSTSWDNFHARLKELNRPIWRPEESK